MRIKNGQGEGNSEENSSQPGGKFHQHVGGLGSEDVFRHPAAKGRAKPFTLWALHQNHKHHEQRYEQPNCQQ